jgi:glycosyltransferase involved in cell wall biosynthesis
MLSSVEKFLLTHSKVFDKVYYIQKNDDLNKIEINPVQHYLKFGRRERRLPSAFFEEAINLDCYLSYIQENVWKEIQYVAMKKRSVFNILFTITFFKFKRINNFISQLRLIRKTNNNEVKQIASIIIESYSDLPRLIFQILLFRRMSSIGNIYLIKTKKPRFLTKTIYKQVKILNKKLILIDSNLDLFQLSFEECQYVINIRINDIFIIDIEKIVKIYSKICSNSVIATFDGLDLLTKPGQEHREHLIYRISGAIEVPIWITVSEHIREIGELKLHEESARRISLIGKEDLTYDSRFRQAATSVRITKKQFEGTSLECLERLLVIDSLPPISSLGRGTPRMEMITDFFLKEGYSLNYYFTEPIEFENYNEYKYKGTGLIKINGPMSESYIAEIYDKLRNFNGVILISRFDNFLKMKRYLGQNLKFIIEKVFFDFEAIDFDIVKQHFENDTEIVKSLGKAKKIFVTNEDEKIFLKKYDIESKVVSYYYKPIESKLDFDSRSDTVCILGNFENYNSSNNEFLRNVLRIINESSGLQIDFKVIGKINSELLADYSYLDNVKFIGEIDDLADEMYNCKIFLALNKKTNGIPIKLFEAIKFGIPCIVSLDLAEKMKWTDGEQCLIARNDSDLIPLISKLNFDKLLWTKIHRNIGLYENNHCDLKFLRKDMIL